MNWSPPDWIREKAHASMDSDVMSNHYSHPRGRPRLIKALSKHYSPQFPNIVARGEDLKPEEIVVTAGANCGECELCHGYYGCYDYCGSDARC
jgi:kynurenine aminotransferase